MLSSDSSAFMQTSMRHYSDSQAGQHKRMDASRVYSLFLIRVWASLTDVSREPK